MSYFNRRVAVIVISHKVDLSEAEIFGLKRCHQILNKHPIFYICPIGLDISNYKYISNDIQFDFIDAKWQKSYRDFNRLKISPLIYEKYSQYDYLLFYEPDSYVFKDELDYWCSLGYSYIGAPWISHTNNSIAFIGVGNGGFSLRKVSDHLRVLRSVGYIIDPITLFNKYFRTKRTISEYYSLFLKFVKEITISNNFYWGLNQFKGNEDIFWGQICSKKFTWYTVPSFETALKFSFEVEPQHLFELNNRELPFGCHAWQKYNSSFWSQFIPF